MLILLFFNCIFAAEIVPISQLKLYFMDYSKITIDLTKHLSTGGSIIEVSDSSFIDLPTLESYLPCVLPYLTKYIVSHLNETKEFTIGIHIQFNI